MLKNLYNADRSKAIDIIYMLIISMFFSLILIFSYLRLDENPYSVFLVFAAMVGTVIGYYTNIAASILYGILFVFLYGSIHIFANVASGVPVGNDVYLWMLIIPAFSVALGYYGSLISDIQTENLALKKENSEYVVIDKDTGLMSSQTFFNELQMYMKIHERYHIEVYLMVIRIRYENQLISILGQSKYEKMINEISKAIYAILREEDRKYILRDLHMFGCILLSNKDGDKYVKNRMKETINGMTFEDDPMINKIKLEVQIGLARFDSEQFSTPYEFFQTAERDLEFDV